MSLLGMISVIGDCASATSHAPIDIQKDNDFNATNGVVSGNGTSANPYVISDWEIHDNGTCINIKGVKKSFIITNVTIYSPAAGETTAIYLSDLTSGESLLDNITIIGPDRNLIVGNCNGITFRNITMGNSSILGFYDCSDLLFIDIDMTTETGRIEGSDSQDCELIRCNTAGYGIPTSDFQGIYLIDCDNIDLFQCNSSGHWIGISIIRGDGCDVVDCDFWNNIEIDVTLATIGTNSHRVNRTRMGPRGLVASASHDIDRSNRVNDKVLHHRVDETGGIIDGDAGQVLLFGCDDFTVANLTMIGPNVALQATECENLTVSDITISALKYCIRLSTVSNLTIEGCSLSEEESPFHGAYGVYANGCPNLSVLDTTFYGLGTCVWSQKTAHLASTSIVRNVTCSEAYLGVGFSEANTTIIDGVTISNGYIGIDIRSSISSTIMNSTIAVNGTYGIRTITTGPAEIEGNIIRGPESGILASGSGINITTNRVSNCRLYGLSSGGEGHHIMHNSWVNCSRGLYIASKDSLVINNTVRDSTYGVWWTGRNVTMRDCSVLNSSIYGIYVENRVIDGSENFIFNSTIDNSSTGIYTTRWDSCNIVECVISNCTIGIDLQGREGVVRSTLIQDCSSYGINGEGFSNRVFWSTFLRTNYNDMTGAYNGPQATCNMYTTFYSESNEGNYWADYQLRYPNAKVVNFKYWDTPYQLVGNNRFDHYPLAIGVDMILPVAMAGKNMTIPQGTMVTLDGTNSSDNIEIVKYEWEFLYGGIEQRFESMVANFTFDHPGLYAVTLTVWDLWDNNASDTIYITVLDTESPFVDAGEDIVVDQGETFTLDATSSSDNVAITIFRWVVDPEGLNLTFDSARASLSIDLIGEYLAILNVSDLAGNWATGTINITVLDTERPVADAGEDLVVDQGTLVTFDGTGSTDNHRIIKKEWSFNYEGETLVLEGDRPTFRFETPGTYIVFLRVTDTAGLGDVDTLIVEVMDTEPPVADCGEDVTIDQGTEATFDGNGSSDNLAIVEYRWEFDYDGEEIVNLAISFVFTFDLPGTYLVTFTVMDGAGHRAEDTLTVTVLDIIPPNAVTETEYTIDQGDEVTFDASPSTDNVGITGFHWTVHDQDGIHDYHGPSVSHRFDVPGVFNVSLVVLDAMENEAVANITVTVLDNIPPVADAGEDGQIFVGRRYHFSGLGSSDNVAIVGYTWSFDYMGATKILHDDEVFFLFEETGVHQVTLYVTDEMGLSDFDVMNLTVLPTHLDFRLGPFVDEDGEPIRGVRVTFTLNGTVNQKNTNDAGWVGVNVIWSDLVSPVTGTATKSGYEDLEFTVPIDEFGNLLDEVPPMKKLGEPEADPSWPVALLVLLAIIIVVAVVLYWRMRR